MNCRPGDTAYIFGLHPALNLNGRVVTLSKDPAFLSCGLWFWSFTKPLRYTTSVDVHDLVGQVIPAGARAQFEALPDMHLRPIRDPGADAVDEMLVRVGAPNYGEVTS